MSFPLPDFTLIELFLCFGIIAFAAILQVSVGMGFGMLASPLIALVKPELVPGSILAMGLIVAFSGAWRERQNIHPTELKLGVSGRVIGSMAALVILSSITELDSFLLVFGLLMLTAVAITASGIKVDFTNRNLLGLSVVSGLVGTITAVGAPPMAIIYHNRPPSIIRPTLNAFFFSSSVLGIGILSLSGWLSVDDLIAAVIFLPAMWFGIWLSSPFKRIPQKILSALLLSLSGLASMSLVLKAIV